MNKALLRSIMTKRGDTQKTLAEAMGLSLSCLNAKINDTKTEFKQREIAFIKRRYSLSAAEIDEVFF